MMNMRGVKERRTLDQFVVHQATAEADMVTAAEVTHIYHTVKHGLSYNSADCALKLTVRTLNDSSIAKKMSCGRTKAEAVVTDLLSPKAIEEVIKKLKSGKSEDVSLGLAVFTPEAGVVNKILDFVEIPDESAEGIVKIIQSSLENVGLSLDQVSAFSADNANVNYGIHNSVFTKLRETNSEILRGNCHAHIVHNTVKKALDKLSVDVENIVLKIYSFFSTSAKRRESLKEFCEFCDVEFHDILRHVVTRWLSLNPAITRLLQNWDPLKSRLKELLKLTEDAAGVEGEADIVEVYLLFCNNVMCLFEEVVKKLEKNVTTSVDLYSIMECFLKRLIQRRDDGFYGYLTRQKLQRLSPSDADGARQEFTAFLDTAISYVRKWFDFSEENWLFHLQPLSLASGKISFDDMEKVIERLHLAGRLNISMDELYEECVTATSLLEHLTKEHQDKEKWQSKGTAEKWMQILQAADLPNIQAVVSFVLSIPSSTGFEERIFSLMNNKWTDVRNKCSTELIRSELIVSLNYDMSCSEFYSAVVKDKQLTAARVKKKYKCKK
ncbi:toll-like receptor 1 [Sarotherodon galilaeus]